MARCSKSRSHKLADLVKRSFFHTSTASLSVFFPEAKLFLASEMYASDP